MNANSGGSNFIFLFNMLAVTFLMLYIFTIRPKKKRDEELNKLRNSLKIGDIVTTIGGIVGIVINIKEDAVTLETGSDKNKIRIKKWAIQSVEKVDNTLNSENVQTKKSVKTAGTYKTEKPATKNENKAIDKNKTDNITIKNENKTIDKNKTDDITTKNENKAIDKNKT